MDLINLKQRGLCDPQMTVGSKPKEPSEATMNITVIHCLHFLPPKVFFSFSIKPFYGKPLKNNPSSSEFNMFRGS